MFEGFVESAAWERISGWARCPAEPGRSVVLDVIIDGSVVLSVVADEMRADLRAAGKGEGRHGFTLALPRSMFAAPLVHVRLRERSSGVDLGGTPFALANDAAGLDPASLAFLADRIGRLDSGAGSAVLDALGAFLLSQLDRVMQARAEGRHQRAQDLEHWAQLIKTGASGSVIPGLIDATLHQYGGAVLAAPTSETPEVSVIIPVHGSFWYTHQCIRRIAEHKPLRPFEVILVDDGSTDETVLASMIISGIRVVRNAANMGFVGSVNAGAAVARGRLLMLLNNDTEVQAGWLDALCDTLDSEPEIGIVGSKLLFPDGTLQECGGIVWRLGDAWNYGRDQDANNPAFCFMRDVDYVSGASLMIRRSVWDEVGGLSPEFAPGYYEDTDLCFKARAAGHRVVVQPGSRIVHHEGISAGRDVAGTGMKRHQRANMARFAAKWADALRSHALSGIGDPAKEAQRGVLRRALFIDDSVPTPDRDAGSNVAVEHMRALIRLGHQVHFVPSDNMARIPPYTEALERLGIRCHVAPYERSAEEVLRNEEGRFDLVYLHRVANARYISAIRARNPAARVIYNVADLHHLRMMRHAELTQDAALHARALAVRTEELAAAAAADCTIVHSSVEASILAGEAPGARVAVIPWVVRPRAVTAAFAARSGVGFVGSSHPPNVDAAVFLLTEVMPLVWATAPEIVLHLIGAHAADPVLRGLVNGHKGRVNVVGWAPELHAALAGLRLTVAPLRFGAGLKGKMLDSMAAGLPCVMTPCAAEGAGLPAALQGLIGESAASLAALIVQCHADGARNAALAEAGLAHIAETCAEGRIDALLGAAIAGETAAAPGAELDFEARGQILHLPLDGQRRKARV